MERANQGTYAHYTWRSEKTKAHDHKRFIFLAIGLLYAASWRLGFQHSDLTPWNLLVHLDDEKNIFPWLIDFDMSTFAPDAPESGSYYVAPIEWFLTPPGTKSAVPYAYDIWSLGMCFLGKLLAKTSEKVAIAAFPKSPASDSLPNYAQLEREYEQLFTYYRICCFHALLHGRPINSYRLQDRNRWRFPQTNQELEAYRTSFMVQIQNEYRDAITLRVTAAEKTLLHQMLHIDPSERIYRGEMFRYFFLPYFSPIDAANLLNRYIMPILGMQRLPNVLERPFEAQVRALVAAGIEPQCGHCGRAAHYVDVAGRAFFCSEIEFGCGALVGKK
jgi:serine/threonine protein kinase